MSVKWDDFTPVNPPAQNAVNWDEFTPVEPRKPRGAADVALDVGKALGGAAISAVGAVPTAAGRLVQEGGEKLLGLTMDEAQRLAEAEGTPEKALEWHERSNRFNPLSLIGRGIESAGGWIGQKGQELRDSRSAVAKEKARQSTPDGDLTDPSTWTMGENPTVEGVVQVGSDVLGSMAPQVATAIATRGQSAKTQMQAGGAVTASQIGGSAMDEATEYLSQFDDNKLREASPVFRELEGKGYSPADARQIIERRAQNQAAAYAAPVGFAGGQATAAILGKPGEKLAGAFGSTIAKSAVLGALGATEEALQEVGEGVATRAGINDATGTNRSLMEGTFGEAVLGAKGGGIVGAARPVVDRIGQAIENRGSSSEQDQAPGTAGQAPTTPGEAAPPAVSVAPTALGAPPATAPTARLVELEILAEQRDLTPAERQEVVDLLTALSQQDEQDTPQGADGPVINEGTIPEAAPGEAPEASGGDATGAVGVPAEPAAPQVEAAGVIPPSTDASGTQASWVILNKDTGEVVSETFDPAKVQALNTAKYQAVPIGDYLGSINGQPKTAPDLKDFWSFARSKGFTPGQIKVGTPEHAALKAEYDSLKAPEPILPPMQPQQDVNLQNRDRGRAASVVQMSEIARNPDYMRLGPSRTPDSGAPMVFAVGDQLDAIAPESFGRQDVAVMSDGQRVPFRYAVVDANKVNPSNFADGRQNPEFNANVPGTIKALNNGRTAGVRAAHEIGAAGEYVSSLQADEAMHGIPADVIARIPNPILVRVYSDADNTAGMAAKSQGQGLGMSPAELARQDAPLMDSSVLGVYEPGDVTAAGNRDFVRAFMGKLQAAGQDVAGMMTGDGQLSQDGRKRIQAALMQAAYGDSDIVEEMFDSTDTDIKAIGEALKTVAGQWANMRDSARLGAINPQTDITDNLLQAIGLIRKARRDNTMVYDLVNQPDLMTGEAPSVATENVLRMFYSGQYLTRAVGKDKLAQALSDYVTGAMATTPDAGLFGEVVTPDQILATIEPVTEGQGDAETQPQEARGQPTDGGNTGIGDDQAQQADWRQGAGDGGAEVVADRQGQPGQDAYAQAQQQAGQGDQATQEGDGAAAERADAGQPGDSGRRAAPARGRARKADGEAVKAKKPAAKEAAEPKARTLNEDGRASDGKPINPGDVFATSSGRKTTGYPKQKAEKYASQWLINNALMEAEARGDSFNARTFSNTKPLKNGTLTTADRESMLMYLFGEQPAVVPSILKPLTGRTDAAPAPASGSEPLLTAPTAEEVVARQDAAEAAQREAEAADRKAAEEERKRQERDEIRRRSEAAADTFELGQDPMDNLSGQNTMFSRTGGGLTQKLRALVAAAMSKGNENQTVVLSPASEEEVALLQREGVPVDEGFVHTVDMFAVRHAINRHGDEKIEKSRGQLAITAADVAQIADAIAAPTAYVLGGKTPRGQAVVGTIKRMTDGTLLYLEEVRSGRKTLAMTSMRKYPGTTDFDTIANSVLPSNARSDTGDIRIIYPDGGEGQAVNFSRAKAKEIRNLVTLHNMSEANLAFADSMGGMPVPSLGIAKVDAPFTGFGNITLVGDKNLVDPEQGVPVFDRDAWTARFPTFNFKKPKRAKADAFYERMKAMAKGIGVDEGNFLSNLWESMVNASVTSPDKVADYFRTYDAPRMAYARAVLEKPIKVPMRPIAARHPFGHVKSWRDFVAKENGKATTEQERAEFNSRAAVAARKAMTEYIEALGESKPNAREGLKQAFGRYLDRYIDDDGMNWNVLDQAIRDAESYGKKEVDGLKLREAVRKVVPDNDPAYLRWVQNQVKPLFDAPTITVRGKEVEPTLDNIVDAMTVGAVQGAEKSLTFGPGKLAASLGKRFKSLAEIQAARDQVVSESAESEAKKSTDALLEEFRTHVTQFFTFKDWRGNVDTWAANDASMEALAIAGKQGMTDANIRSALSRKDFKGVDQRTIDLARQSIEAIRSTATNYFEAKPRRAVKLNEFKGAVVPRGLSPESLSILEKNGIALEFYGKGEGAREKAIEKLAKRLDRQSGDVLFSFAGEKSLTHDDLNLAYAQDLVARGDDAETVRKETGWFQGKDGKWRYEISDKDAIPKGTGTFGEVIMRWYQAGVDRTGDQLYRTTVGDVLYHPALFAAYPDLAKIEVQMMPKSSRARGRLQRTEVNGQPYETIIQINEDLPSSEWLSVLLHELQHGIQHVEGFATGGPSGEMMWLGDMRPIAMAEYQKLVNEIKKPMSLEEYASKAWNSEQVTDEIRQDYTENFIPSHMSALERQGLDKDLQQTAGWRAYKRLAGEVEARNTQARSRMTDAERRATPPSATQDVPDSDVIVMFNGKVAENAPMPANIRRPGAMTEPMVRQVANTIAARWTQAPDIVVVPNMQDMRVPEAARNEDARQRAAGATGVPRGFYHRGTVYLVADGLKSVSDAAEALFHESLGHFGLRSVFGTELNPILDQIAMARPDLVKPKAEEYGKDLKVLKQRREVAEEVLAEMAQTKPELGFVKRAIAAIRTWLRKNVPAFKDMALTDSEIINSFILPARNWVERGERAMRPGGRVAFLRAFHGTPHRGIEKFDTEFIGTGEGAQAYGWGIYLASRRDVAEYYRKSVSDSRGSRFSIAGDMPASPNEGLSNDEAVATKDLAEFFVPNPKVVQTFGSLNVVSQGRVLGMVRRLVQNRKVLDAVISLVPVDVVNMLSRSQLSTDGLLDNPAMLVDLLPVNANDLVPSDIQAMNVLAPLVAVAAAKVHTGSSRFDLTRGAVERATASAASKDQDGLQEFYRNIPQPSEFVKGQLYEVEIPEDNDMLLWDKPLSEQPEAVRKALSQWASESSGRWETGAMGERRFVEPGRQVMLALRGAAEVSGEQFYRSLGESQAASEALASLGIKGIKYMDGVSRNKPLRDVKREFLAELPEDAGFDEVMDLVGAGKFSPKNDALLKALQENDWLGFDYPAQALSTALSSQLQNYDASPDLVQAVAATQDDSSYNYVVFSGDDVAIQQTFFSRGQDQTQTPEFKRWFGDSKVVDADGKPLVVYHGSNSDIQAFRASDTDGIYFSSDPDYAGGYAEVKAQAIGGNAATYPAFLSLQNPLLLDGESEANWEKYTQRGFNKAELAAQGYDGVVMRYPDGEVEAMAFDPAQIKSATGNRGTFDPASSDIRFSRRQTIEQAAAKIAAIPQSRRDNMEVGDFEGGAEAYNLFEARQLLPKPSDKLKRVTEKNSFSLWQDYDYIANVDGEHFGVAKQEDPDSVDDDDAFVYSYESLHGGRDSGTTSATDQADLLFDEMRAYKRSQLEPANPNVSFSRSTLGNQPQPTPPGQQNAWQKLKAKALELTSPEAIDNIIYELQDKNIDLKRLRDHIKELGGTITDLNDAYLGEELYHKRLAKRTQDFLSEELKPLLADLRARGLDLPTLETYLHARHAPEANKVLADRNPNQQMINAGRQKAAKDVKALEVQLQRAQAQGTATKAIEQAMEQAREQLGIWNRAQAFKGTEEERLSLSGMSDQAAADFVANLPPGQKVHLDALVAKVDAMNAKTLDTLDKYGLADKAQLDAWRSTYQFYVPLHRDEAHPDAVSHPIGQGFSTKGDAGKRRTGSNEKVTNILAHVAMQREAALTRGEKNRVAKKLYLMASQNPDPEVWSVDKPPMTKTVDKETGFVRTGVDPTYRNAPNVLMVRIGGRDHAVVFNERNPQALRMALSLKNQDIGDAGPAINTANDVATKLIRGTVEAGKSGTRWLASVNTQYNPIFGIINFARDVQAAVLQLSTTPLAGQERAVASYVMPAMKGIYSEVRARRKGKARGTGDWAKLWEDMQDEGGTTGFRDLFADPNERMDALMKELNALDRGQVKEAFFAVVDWLSDYNEVMENAVRLAAYKVALDQGMAKERAASLAKNITVNFNRKGRTGTKIGAWYAFFNAAVQGTARMVETLKGPAGKKIIYGGVALGAVNTLIGMAIMGGGDDEEDNWSKIPEFVRERSLIIPLSREDYVAIPMPLGYHVLPNMGRKLVEMAFNGDPEASIGGQVAEMLRLALDAFNPLGGSTNPVQMLTPTIADPAMALIQNRDWTGKTIYREDTSGLDPSPGFTRAKDSASTFSKTLTEAMNKITGGTEYQPGAINWTPDQVDYIIGQVTGGVGRELMKVEQTLTAPFTGDELPPNKIPLFGRLYGNTSGPSSESERFYQNVIALNGIEREIKGRARAGEDYDTYLAGEPLAELVGLGNAAQNQISQLRRARREIVREGLPGYQEEVKTINEQIGAVMKNVNQEVRRAKQEARQ